jgi:hypothetical protein
MAKNLENQQTMIHEALWVGSDGWEHFQEALVAIAFKEGSRFVRPYRVQIVYREIHEKRYVENMTRLLFDVTEWEIIPASQRTSRLRCLAFRVTTAGLLLFFQPDLPEGL